MSADPATVQAAAKAGMSAAEYIEMEVQKALQAAGVNEGAAGQGSAKCPGSLVRGYSG